jgi:hypothetical protein
MLGTKSSSLEIITRPVDITTLQGDNAGNGHQIVLTDRVYIQPNKNMWLYVSVLGELTITASGGGGGYLIGINTDVRNKI